jgi:TRAP-type C4-dicarboxylate transport system permease large subunit
MSYELIALLMFSSMLILLLTGQRVFGGHRLRGGALRPCCCGGGGGPRCLSTPAFVVLNWYPLVTLPLFVYMGYMLSEAGIARRPLSDVSRLGRPAQRRPGHRHHRPYGHHIGHERLERRRHGHRGQHRTARTAASASYDKVMVTGVIQAGSSLGILIPPSVVLVLYGMIARQPVGQSVVGRCFPRADDGRRCLWSTSPSDPLVTAAPPRAGPAAGGASADELARASFRLLRAGIIPLVIFFSMTGLFIMGVTSLVESSAVGAAFQRRIAARDQRPAQPGQVLEETVRKTLSDQLHVHVDHSRRSLPSERCSTASALSTPSSSLFLERWELTPWEVLMMMQISYIVMGMFLDDTAMLVIVAPLYVPLVVALGFDPIWYGILYTITCQIAYMTPPFGYNLCSSCGPWRPRR